MINLFHRNFDAETDPIPVSAETDTAPESPRSYSPEQVEEMLTQIRTATFADGKAAGIAEARAEEQASRETRVADALSAIREFLADLTQQDEARRREIEAEMTELVLGIGERIVPEVMANCAIDQVTARIRAGLRMAAGGGGITIRVAPAIRDQVTERLPESGGAGNDRLPVDILTDPALPEGAARLEWRNGFMEYDLGRACDEVLDTLRDATAKLNPKSGKVI